MLRLSKYNKLGNEIIIYRGVTPFNEQNVKALSWTLDYDKANWFAQRYGQDGSVYQAKINKNDIFAYFNGRKEQEIIVNPKHLKNITVVNESELENE